MMRASRSGRSHLAGVSLVEVTLVAAVLMILARMLVETSTSMSQLTTSGNVQAILQQQGEKALTAIVADFRRSGELTVDGKDYPYVFDDGDAEGDFEDHDHPVCDQSAEPGDADFGVMREIIVVLPADLDDNKIPDLDMDENGWPEFDGNRDGTATEDPEDYEGIDWDPALNTIEFGTGVVWAHDEISYVAVTRPDGANYLERRVNASPDRARRVARDVELVQFDTWASSGFTIAMNSVRVRLFLRRTGPDGRVFRHQVEAVVRLRNTRGLD